MTEKFFTEIEKNDLEELLIKLKDFLSEQQKDYFSWNSEYSDFIIQDFFGTEKYIKFLDRIYSYQINGNQITFEFKDVKTCNYYDFDDIDFIIEKYQEARTDFFALKEKMLEEKFATKFYTRPTEDDSPFYIITKADKDAAEKWWKKHNKKYNHKSYFTFEISQTHISDMLYCVCEECNKKYLRQDFKSTIESYKAWEKTRKFLHSI